MSSPDPSANDCAHCLERLKSRLLVDLSHELRTPLTLILGPLADLRSGRHGELSTAAREQLDLALRGAARLQGMVTQVLDTAHLESGRLELRPRRVDLSELLAGLARDFRDLAERRGLELDFRKPPAPFPLDCDPDQLVKIVSNLLANALRYSPDGSRVELEVKDAESGVTITVRDRGPGVPAEDRERIFDRYHRVCRPAPAGDAGDAGTGLGLPLARQLAELHGGTLTLDSPPGEGAAFRVELPRDQQHLSMTRRDAGSAGILPASVPKAKTLAGSAGILPVSAKTQAPETNGTAPKARSVGATRDQTTVLVVDDDREIRAYLRSHLEPRYRVELAADGADGLERARDLLPDLVVSDVMMPEMDGHALCRNLKQDPELDWIPVLLLTARAALDDRLEGFYGGADAYLPKPFDRRELSARVDNLIDSRRRLRRSFAAGRGLPRLRLPLAPGVRPVNGDRAWLERVRAAIDESLGDGDFTVEALARELAVHRGRLHKRLKQLTGKAPLQLIAHLRLERARTLLETGTDSISEIGYAVGFRSVAHFSSRFSRRYGRSPSSWRSDRRTGLKWRHRDNKRRHRDKHASGGPVRVGP